MMAAVNHVDFDPPSPRPPPILDELETLALDDDDDDDDSFSPRLLSTVPVAIDGGNPLLRPRPCPPSSSTSSSPSSSPTAAYAAVFESQNGVGGGGRGRNGAAAAAAVAAPPSPRRAAVATEFVGITVSEPQKAHDPTASLISGSSTFVTYLVTARAADRGGEFRVRRRFRDVVALADRLAEAYRGFFVPARPDKSVVEGQVMQKHEFVEQRRAAIERYLRRLAAHPVIGRSEELRAFLRAPGRLSLPPLADDVAARPIARESGAAMPTGKGGRDMFRMFRELKQSVVNDWGGRGRAPEVDEDKEFLERKAKLQEWEKQLSSTSQQLLLASQYFSTSQIHEVSCSVRVMLRPRNALSSEHCPASSSSSVPPQNHNPNPINPQSGIGGPLLNLEGEVIGINFFGDLCTPFLLINVASRWWAHFKKYGLRTVLLPTLPG